MTTKKNVGETVWFYALYSPNDVVDAVIHKQSDNAHMRELKLANGFIVWKNISDLYDSQEEAVKATIAHMESNILESLKVLNSLRKYGYNCRFNLDIKEGDKP